MTNNKPLIGAAVIGQSHQHRILKRKADDMAAGTQITHGNSFFEKKMAAED